jgi:predicted dehydrogenase
MRFGLVGTGHWARTTHAPAIASTPGTTLRAVWGRDAVAAATLAAEYGATAHDDIDGFLASVDAVAFAVPPHVQVPIAIRAAEAGKHLLLEKPIALSAADADELVKAVESANVASVVFVAHRFNTEIRAWLADEAARGGWTGGGWSGGVAVWLGSALLPGNPFNTPWRREKGGLWDLGPHVVSMLWACLGPVTAVDAVSGAADVTHLVLAHESGASSTATMTLSAPSAASGSRSFPPPRPPGERTRATPGSAERWCGSSRPRKPNLIPDPPLSRTVHPDSPPPPSASLSYTRVRSSPRLST